jgi:hypothetical protein
VRGQLVAHTKRYPLDRMREIEEQSEEARRRAAEEAEAARHHPGYGVLAAVYRSETAAAELLTELVDAGHDGTVVATESGGSVLYEIRLGPYRELREAREASEAISGAFGLSPTVILESPPEGAGAEVEAQP